MITIVGDTVKELCDVQIIMGNGVLNTRTNFINDFSVTYKLSSGNDLLCDQNNNIIGDVLPDGTRRILIDRDKSISKITCNYSDEEIAKSFIEDVEAVKDQLLFCEVKK